MKKLLIVFVLFGMSCFLGCSNIEILVEWQERSPAVSPTTPTEMKIDETDMQVFAAKPKAVIGEQLPSPLNKIYASAKEVWVEHSIERVGSSYLRRFVLIVYDVFSEQDIQTLLTNTAGVEVKKLEDCTQFYIETLLYENPISELIDKTYPVASLPTVHPVLKDKTPDIRSIFISSSDEKVHFKKTWQLSEGDYNVVMAYYMPLLNGATDAQIENIDETDTRLSGQFGRYRLSVDFIYQNGNYGVSTEVEEV